MAGHCRDNPKGRGNPAFFCARRLIVWLVTPEWTECVRAVASVERFGYGSVSKPAGGP